MAFTLSPPWIGLWLSVFCAGSFADGLDGISFGPFADRLNDTSIDDGHLLLLRIALDPRNIGFAQSLGFNWTGGEILCNCSGSVCGNPTTTKILKSNGLSNVCIGLACYKKKAYTIKRNAYEKVEHSGCFGGDRDDHNTHFTQQEVFCANTSLVNTICCHSSFCNSKIDNFEWPLEEKLMQLPSKSTLVSLSWVLVGLAFVLILIPCTCVGFFTWYPNKLLAIRSFILHRTGRQPQGGEHAEADGQPMLDRNTLTTGIGSGVGSRSGMRRIPRPRPPELNHLMYDLDTSNSGSGSGLPLLAQRTIARQIELVREIGQGRFGEVWLGQWRGQQVAVKLFSSRDERSWFREVETFQTHMLRHSNILQFIASDSKDTGIAMQLWLVTEYHAHGSLFDYLSEKPIDEVILIQFIRSLANGLSFLHTEIPGNPGKPSIAHRDMKSKNVLVKKDMTCVVADLGLAVRLERGQLNLPDNNKCGTVRYLSPELLDDALETFVFNSYRYADIYALGLVFWEMARRTECPQGPVSSVEESLPFFSDIGREPTLEEMREVVFVQRKRPLLSPHWTSNVVLSEVMRVMRECWATQPSARLTATNVRIAMDRLASKVDAQIER